MTLLRHLIGGNIIQAIAPMILNQRKSPTEETPAIIKLPGNSDAFSQVAKDVHARMSIYEQVAMRIAKLGISDGANGIPEEDSTSSHAESQIDHEYQSALDDVLLTIATARAHLERKQATIVEMLQDGSIEKEQQDKNLFKKRTALHEAERTVRNANMLKEELRQMEEKKLHVDTRFQTLLLDTYRNVPPAKGLINSHLFFTGFILFLFMVEFFANFTAFQHMNIGGYNFGSLVIGFFFTLFQALSAKELGKAIYDKNTILRNLFAGATFIFCLFICFTRFSTEDGVFLKAFYILLNVIIAGATTFIAYCYAKNRRFFAAQEERNRLAKQIIKYGQRIEQIESDHKNRIDTIEEQYRIEIDQRVNATRSTLQSQVTQIESEISKLDAEEDKSSRKLNTLRLLALEKYQQFNSAARKDSGYAPVKRWLQRPAHGSNHLFKKVSIALLLFSVCMSCSKPSSTHIEVLYDQTDGINGQKTEPMLAYIMEHVEEDLKSGSWGEITVALSPIGETSTQVTQIVSLKASDPYWLRNENMHKQQPEIFRQAIKIALDSLTKPAPELNHSYIYRNFYYRLSELSKKQGKRLVLSWSDLIVNTPEINFYHYKKRPQQILAHKDSLIAIMTRNYPLKNLDGITLVNFHQPSKANDELHEVSKQLLRYHWEKLGMRVDFKSSLPSQIAALNAATKK